MKRLYTGLMCLALLCALLCGCEGMPLQAPETPSYTLEEVPAYSGEPYVVLNGNDPTSRRRIGPPIPLSRIAPPETSWAAAAPPTPTWART